MRLCSFVLLAVHERSAPYECPWGVLCPLGALDRVLLHRIRRVLSEGFHGLNRARRTTGGELSFALT